MHILIISSIYPPSGGGIFIHDQALALKKKGLIVGVLKPNFPHPSRVFSGRFSWSCAQKPYSIDEIPVRNFIFFPIPFFHLPITALLGSIALLRYIKLFGKPDIIHAHFIWYSGVIGCLLGKIFGIPVVVTCHHSKHFYKIPKYNFFEAKFVLKNVDFAVSVSEFLRERLLTLYGDYQITTIPNTVNTELFTPNVKDTSKRKLFHYTSIGKLREGKGYEVLIRAFSRIINLDRSILNIVGDGPDREYLINLASSLKLDGKVIFHGKLTCDKLIGLLQKTNAVVSASNLETFGVTIIEALSCGIPVVATRSGGPEEIINKDNGILVEKDNISDLCSGLERIFKNFDSFNQKEIRADCLKRFGYRIIADRLTDVYENLLS